VHVELIDKLRCIRPHDDSWLVAAASESVGRQIVRGTLGCPVCKTEYEIRDGEVWFGSDDEVTDGAGDSSDSSDPARRARADRAREFDDARIRLAALLGLNERGGLYLLCGAWARFADSFEEFGPAQWLLVSPPQPIRGDGTLRGCGDLLPVARGSLRGVALHRPSVALAGAAVSALGAGGRLIAPAATPVPGGVTVLARADRGWGAERAAGASFSGGVTPRRATPRTDRQ